MLPVVSGIKNTKIQIILYSISMFLITLLPYILGYFGIIYFLTSIILGLYFIYHSFKVYFDNQETKSIKMFLYSIVYLYLLFLSMIIDYFII